MSTEVTTSFVQQYSSNVQMLVQQKGSKLRGLVRQETVNGKAAFFDQIGVTYARQRTSRHADTPRMDTPHARRRVTVADYDWADLIDREDKVRMLVDPTSEYAMAAAWAMGRSMDEVIIDAAFGTAYTGETGSSTTTITTAQTVAVASTGLTLAKLLAAKEILDGNNVSDEGRYIALTAGQVTDLLNTTEIKDSDYNTVKALAAGQLNTFLGFTFIPVNGLRSDATKILPLNGSSHRRVLCWQKDCLLLGMGAEPMAKISERDDKNYATQVFYSMTLGATRMQEEGVVEIVCDE